MPVLLWKPEHGPPHLSGHNVLLPLDVQQSTDVVNIGFHLLEARCHAALLVPASEDFVKMVDTPGRPPRTNPQDYAWEGGGVSSDL